MVKTKNYMSKLWYISLSAVILKIFSLYTILNRKFKKSNNKQANDSNKYKKKGGDIDR